MPCRSGCPSSHFGHRQRGSSSHGCGIRPHACIRPRPPRVTLPLLRRLDPHLLPVARRSGQPVWNGAQHSYGQRGCEQDQQVFRRSCDLYQSCLSRCIEPDTFDAASVRFQVSALRFPGRSARRWIRCPGRPSPVKQGWHSPRFRLRRSRLGRHCCQTTRLHLRGRNRRPQYGRFLSSRCFARCASCLPPRPSLRRCSRAAGNPPTRRMHRTRRWSLHRHRYPRQAKHAGRPDGLCRRRAGFHRNRARLTIARTPLASMQPA